MYQETLKDIRKRCRMAMNGLASTSMRGYGLNYKLNFGVSLQKIKEISDRYKPDAGLAEELWKDGTRELKILATLLYPKDLFSEQIALRWIEEIPNQEIREQLGFNLFRYLPYALSVSKKCINYANESIRASGYWFSARSLMSDHTDFDITESLYVWDDIVSEDISLRNATSLFLKQLGKKSEEKANEILEKISPLRDSKNPISKEAYDSLAFEFEFFHNQ